MVKVAACLIVKATDDEADLLDKCLTSVEDYVDGLFVNINHAPGTDVSVAVHEVAKKHNANIIITEWHDDFAEARNRNFGQVPADFTHILWLDADDTVKNPKKIKEIAKESEQFDAIYVDYLYDHDEAGNPTLVHMVARLVKNNGSHKWKGTIHETLIQTRSCTQGMTKDFTVVHNSTLARQGKSYERNVRMLEAQLEQESSDPDPRTMYYLACTYLDSGQTDVAEDLLKQYLEISGWSQERSVAHTKLGKLYLERLDHSAAKEQFLLAIGEDVDNPDPRIELGSLELELKEYAKATHWLEGVIKMKKDLTTLERNPMNYTFRTYLLLADAYLNIGGPRLADAAKYAKKARQYKKKDKDIVDFTEMVEHVYADKVNLEKALNEFRDLKQSNKTDEAIEMLLSLPDNLRGNPVVATILKKEQGSMKWPDKSIAIMTGDTVLDGWGPWSLAEGIGGSEEAIIRISKELAALGYKVVVFGKPGHRTGLDESTGVMWRNFWDCNLDDEFDIFIGWRAPYLFNRKIKARKSYLWLHDVMEPGEFTETRIANFTKCIVLTKYHRSLFPMIPDEKILLAGNGITAEDFTEFEQDGKWIARDPHRVIYMSSHVRGLSYLYDIWPEVKKAVPDATLHVYYGRESYDAVNRGNPERMKWMDDMVTRAKKLEGVTDHGKVSQYEIVQNIFKSGVWAYPCPFPEVYCITAIKAQCGGAVPVSSNFAALDETVQFGHKQPFEQFNEDDLTRYKEALIWWLQHPEEQERIRPEMEKWARSQTWKSVANIWQGDFNE